MSKFENHGPISFVISCGTVRVTDPCYDATTECAGTISKVLNGQWKGFTIKSDEGDWGKRVAALFVHHESWIGRVPTTVEEIENDMEMTEFDIGVDSGQAGIFDADEFNRQALHIDHSNNDESNKHNAFYSLACEVNNGPEGAGSVGFGINSCSGYGDGGYDCYHLTNDGGEVEAIAIVFIPTEEDQEDKFGDEYPDTLT